MKHRKKTEEARQAKQAPGNQHPEPEAEPKKRRSSTNMQAQDYHWKKWDVERRQWKMLTEEGLQDKTPSPSQGQLPSLQQPLRNCDAKVPLTTACPPCTHTTQTSCSLHHETPSGQTPRAAHGGSCWALQHNSFTTATISGHTHTNWSAVRNWRHWRG